MTTRTISILINNEIKIIEMYYDEHPPTIRFTLENGLTKEFNGQDVYECLGKIIKDMPEVNFLCKGAKLNVRPSSMSSQMTSGVMAYEHNLCSRVTRQSVVNIFDYDDQDIINDPKLQTDYFFRWLKSLKKNTKHTNKNT